MQECQYTFMDITNTKIVLEEQRSMDRLPTWYNLGDPQIQEELKFVTQKTQCRVVACFTIPITMNHVEVPLIRSICIKKKHWGMMKCIETWGQQPSISIPSFRIYSLRHSILAFLGKHYTTSKALELAFHLNLSNTLRNGTRNQLIS